MKYAKHLCLLLGFVLFSTPIWGSDQTMQASMTLTGSIRISPEGNVTGYRLDKASRIPSGARAEMAKAVPHWKFEPVRVNGKAVSARSTMHVRLVAKHSGKDSYSISVESAWFTNKHAVNETDMLRAKDRTPPRYPAAAIREYAQGTVYTVLRINRQGKVDKFAIRQVNLRTRGNSAQQRRWRRMLAKASERAVKDWTYTPPTTGPSARQDHWIAVVPITFRLNVPGENDAEKRRARLYGKWQAYIPGPRHAIPWVKDTEKRLVANADALPGSGTYPVGQALHLRTSLSAGG